MSGRKNFLPPFAILTAGNMASASVTTSPVNVMYLDNISMQFVWTGTTPIGVITIQASNTYNQDANGNVLASGTWTTLSITPAISVSGNSGSLIVDINQTSYPWVRAVYTKTSGTGSITCTVSGKMI